MFYSFTDSFAEQPKYIAQELLRRGCACELVWLTRKGAHTLPAGVRAVRSRLRMAYELATARVIISDARMGKFFDKGYRKKKGQVYFQTWHGSFGIKKIEASLPGLSGTYIRRARKDSRHINYMLSNSRWLTGLYRACFYYSGKVLELGSPRNDVLLNPGSVPAEVRRKLGIAEGVRLALYAPTFRKAGVALEPLPDYTRLRRALSERFGGEWVVLLRSHPSVLGREMRLTGGAGEGVAEVSAYPDAAELLAAADVLVSDYSACLFDYLLTGKPSFIYAPDMEEYENTRGLYYPLSEAPCPLAQSSDELVAQVRAFDAAAYREKTNRFLAEKGCVDDGHAAEKVVDLLEGILAK